MFVLSDDQESLLHFKLRVLDLLEVFLRREPVNPLFLVGWRVGVVSESGCGMDMVFGEVELERNINFIIIFNLVGMTIEFCCLPVFLFLACNCCRQLFVYYKFIHLFVCLLSGGGCASV